MSMVQYLQHFEIENQLPLKNVANDIFVKFHFSTAYTLFLLAKHRNVSLHICSPQLCASNNGVNWLCLIDRKILRPCENCNFENYTHIW